MTTPHAAIVAGGWGTRASAMTGGRIPKALLPVAGIPIIVRQMHLLRREGVTHLTVLAGHLGNQLQEVLAPEATSLGLQLQINVEEAPLGTAGCLASLVPSTDDLLIINGDMLFDIDIAPLYEFHRTQHAVLTVLVHPNDHPRTSDLIVEENGLVKAILPVGKPRENDYRNLVPAGIYLVSPAFFTCLEPGRKADMIRDVLPALVATGARVAAYNTPEYLRDIGSPARHELAERDLLAGRVDAMNRRNLRPAIFFDCDGVLNEEPGQSGILVADDIKLSPGAGDAVRRTRDAGHLAVAVTNRPQVAKGFLSLEGLSHVLGRLEACLAERGGVLDRIYFCPHHPEAGFPGEVPALKIPCECRKPGTLLLRQAFTDLPISRRRSVLIGDSLRDIAAARGVGIWAYGVRTGHGCRDRKSFDQETLAPPVPDLMFDGVSEAVDFQIEYSKFVAPVVASIRELINSKERPVFVGLCGHSRAGKSSAAHAIVRVLAEQSVTCLHVRLDNWIVSAIDRRLSSSTEARNRVEAMPGVLRALQSGKCVRAPGYDAATRSAQGEVVYDPTGQSVIVLDGIFAGHQSIRKMLDYVAFITAPPESRLARFVEFYRWKELDENAIETLWLERTKDEWPAVDAQRNGADLILTSGIGHS
jgi:mannose-1-phosphate guanylyltransferase/phosphomannomutase